MYNSSNNSVTQQNLILKTELEGALEGEPCDSQCFADDDGEDGIITEGSSSEELDYESQEKSLGSTIDCDLVDIEKYLDEVITNPLETLRFKPVVLCYICGHVPLTYEHILGHIALLQVNEVNELSCVVGDCLRSFRDDKVLARHIILSHSDLDSLQVYVSCPTCGFKCANFANFNKHSCCRTLKREGSQVQVCETCKAEFPSFKRLVFHAQEHMSQRRPKICLICEMSFVNMERFFEHVQYAHESTDSYFCTSCDIMFLNKTYWEQHKQSHQFKCTYLCGYCPKEYNHKQLLTAHWEKFHKSMTMRLKCDECSRTFLMKANLVKHVREAHPPKVQVFLCISCGLLGSSEAELLTHSRTDTSLCYRSRISQEVLTTAYSCEFCYASFKHPTDLKLHRISGTHTAKVYSCPLCPKEFEACRNMRSHLKTHKTYAAWLRQYPLTRSYMCDVGDCEKTFTSWDVLSNHRRRSHRPHDCLTCQKTFSDQEAFEQHKSSCSKEIDLVCPICRKACPTKMSLSVHISRSHNNRNVTCPTCEMSYKDDTALREHIDYEHVRTQCPHCPKVIKNKRNLKLHVRKSHLKERRFFCQDCSKSYYQRSELNAHVQHVHRKEKLQCDVCPFTTSYAIVLKRHRTDHENRSSFQCSFCWKQFNTRHLLELHKQEHKRRKSSTGAKNTKKKFRP